MDSSTSPTGAAVYPEVIAESRPRNSPYSGLMLSTARYLLRTDVHTFAFSVAANSILSFFPFLVLLMTLTRNIFHSWTMSYAIEVFLRDALPAGQDFVIHNLNAIVSSRHRVQILSLLILLVTSTGIFMPLEVALNRVWGFRNNRSYFGNQLISLGLAFACGLLALFSIALTAGNMFLLRTLTFGHGELVIEIIGFLAMKIFAIGASIGIFFLIYWLLPNGRVSAPPRL
jgi:membrane protein